MTNEQLRVIAEKLLKEATQLSASRKLDSNDAEFHSKGVGVTILLALSGAFFEASHKGGCNDRHAA